MFKLFQIIHINFIMILFFFQFIPVNIQLILLIIVNKTSSSLINRKSFFVHVIQQIFVIFFGQRCFDLNSLAFTFWPSNGAGVRPSTVSTSFSQTALCSSFWIALPRKTIVIFYTEILIQKSFQNKRKSVLLL